MSRAFTGYVSRYQRSRVWSQEFYRTEKFTLIADFTGALLDGVTIESAVWQSFNNANVILGTAVAFEKKTEVECTAGLEPGSAVKVEVTLSDGSIMNQLFAVNVRSSPWFCEDTVPAQGPCHVTAIVYEPSLTVEKTAFPSSFVAEGDIIQYYYTVTNTGNTEITDIAVTDDLVATVTCPYTSLDVGESMVCSGSYEVTGDDVTAGEITNVATAIASGTSYVAPNATITVTSDTELTITDFGISGDAPGGTVGDVYVGYTYTTDGGAAPITYSISSGALPDGLALNASTSEITGTPTVAGDFSFTVLGTDNDGATASVADTMAIAAACLEIDYTTDLYFAGGINRIISGYAGALLRVKRESDSTEEDIGQDVDGALDVNALETFCAATNGVVTQIYKQAGSYGFSVANFNSGREPAIVTAGSYIGWMAFDGTNDGLQLAENGSTSDFPNVTFLAKLGIPSSNPSNGRSIFDMNGNNQNITSSFPPQANDMALFWKGTFPNSLYINYGDAAANTNHNLNTYSISMLANNSTIAGLWNVDGSTNEKVQLWVNGVLQAPTILYSSNPVGETGFAKYNIGCSSVAAGAVYSPTEMNLNSFLIYNAALSTETIEEILASLACRYAS